jgi:hypothetical protein
VQVAEALTEQHRGAPTHRGHGQSLECSRPALRQSKEVAVCGDIRPRRCDRVCRQPSFQRLARRREHRGRAERVPANASVDLGPLSLCRGCRRDPTYAVIRAPVERMVALDSSRISLRPVLRVWCRHDAGAPGREDEQGCEKQRGRPRQPARLCALGSSPTELLSCNEVHTSSGRVVPRGLMGAAYSSDPCGRIASARRIA